MGRCKESVWLYHPDLLPLKRGMGEKKVEDIGNLHAIPFLTCSQKMPRKKCLKIFINLYNQSKLRVFSYWQAIPSLKLEMT